MGCVCDCCAEHVPASIDACAFCVRHCVTRAGVAGGMQAWFTTPASYRRAAHAARGAPRLRLPTEAELRQQAANVAVETLAPLVERGVHTLWDVARKRLLRLGRR